MPQGRMLNKKISTDEVVALLSKEANILYTWAIPHLDVEGRIHADPPILKGKVVPFLKYMTLSTIQKCIDELGKSGLVLVYGNDYKYMEFKGFRKNQKLNKDREAVSNIPSPKLWSNSGVSPAKLNQIKLNKGESADGASLESPPASLKDAYEKHMSRIGGPK